MEYKNFHGDDVEQSSPKKALFHILPVPYEKSVSYGTGTALGPKAILDASTQLELFDGKSIPAEAGIHTLPPVNCDGDHEEALERIDDAVSMILEYGKIPVILGGEHTVTNGSLRAIKREHEEFGIVQFDAHADLRDSYEGSPYSHACVMKRTFDAKIPFFQIGVRSISQEGVQLREEHQIPRLDANQLYQNGIPDPLLPSDFPEKIYITFDIDALDPSIMPATGTPEPGGLQWYQSLELLDKIIMGRTVIGFDLVELAPIESLPHPDFTAAKLVYSIMGMITRNR